MNVIFHVDNKVIFFLDSIPILLKLACMQYWYNSREGLILIMEFRILIYLYQYVGIKKNLSKLIVMHKLNRMFSLLFTDLVFASSLP